MSLITSFPDEIIVDILARAPRSNYPTLSLVSKRFRSLVASTELYKRRSLLGCTEHCLYVALYDSAADEIRWYILHRNRLILIPALPAMPTYGCSTYGCFVVVGSRIYAFSGVYEDETTSSSNALSVDCRSHAVQPLPDLPMPVSTVIAAIVEKKIYVVGVIECKSWLSPRVMVFDTETQTWERGMIKPEIEIDLVWYSCVVMGNKIYMTDHVNSFAYGPMDGKWETNEVLGSEKWKSGCVVDDVLYYYNDDYKKLRAYDPRQRCWTDVKGVEELLSEATGSLLSSYSVNHGDKLVVFVTMQLDNMVKEVWCVEVAIEKRRGGEICGKVEWCEIVSSGNLQIHDCVSVVV